MRTKDKARKSISLSTDNDRSEDFAIQNQDEGVCDNEDEIYDGDIGVGIEADDDDDEVEVVGNDDFAEEEEDDHVVVEDNAEEVFSNQFGHVVGDRDSGDSEDSCDDNWADDRIPDPQSADEDDGFEEGDSDNPEDGGESILKLGKCFSSAAKFKTALLRYSLLTMYDIKMYISNMKKLGVVCSDKTSKCPWRVYCSYEKRKCKLQIKVLESKHTCIRSGYTKLLKCGTIAQLFEEKLQVNPSLKAVEMASEIKRRYNLIVTVEKCKKAKTKLRNQRRRRHEEQFARIWDYAAELQSTNEWTIIDIETVPGPTTGSMQRFDRIYISFEVQRFSWRQYCRPIIGLDGALLKWDIKGQLLAAVGRDGDNRIISIAWAVVDIENEANWVWFIEHMRIDLGLGDGNNFTIISDKQKVK